MATFTILFLVNDGLVWSDNIKTVLGALEYGARYASAFMHFVIFLIKNSKSPFSVDNMPVHALDVFIENATEK